jgi:hypothetical protein
MVDTENALLLYMRFWHFVKTLYSCKVLSWKLKLETPVFCIRCLKDFQGECLRLALIHLLSSEHLAFSLSFCAKKMTKLMIGWNILQIMTTTDDLL